MARRPPQRSPGPALGQADVAYQVLLLESEAARAALPV
jgi:hypothetical protein